MNSIGEALLTLLTGLCAKLCTITERSNHPSSRTSRPMIVFIDGRANERQVQAFVRERGTVRPILPLSHRSSMPFACDGGSNVPDKLAAA